jgi:hypothetical protein
MSLLLTKAEPYRKIDGGAFGDNITVVQEIGNQTGAAALVYAVTGILSAGRLLYWHFTGK